MVNFKIKITGSGTLEEVLESLESMKQSLKKIDSKNCECNMEDETLCMEVSVEED